MNAFDVSANWLSSLCSVGTLSMMIRGNLIPSVAIAPKNVLKSFEIQLIWHMKILWCGFNGHPIHPGNGCAHIREENDMMSPQNFVTISQNF